MTHQSVLAIIPARAGSKRLPDKNIKYLAGKPLIVHSIECARKTPCISRIIVSTDSEKIQAIAIEAGAEVPFLRPPQLATDTATTVEVISHALHYLVQHEAIAYRYLVLLQPTSPLRTTGDIMTAFKLLTTSEADSVVSVAQTPFKGSHWVTVKDGRIALPTPAEEARAGFFRLNGAIYISKMENLLHHGTLLGKTIIPYFMPEFRSIDIDTLEDFRIAEALMHSYDHAQNI